MEIKHPELHGNSSKTVISSRQICPYPECDRSFYVLESLQQHLAGHKIVDDIFKTTSPTLYATPPTDAFTYNLRKYPSDGTGASITILELIGTADRTPTLSDATVIPHPSVDRRVLCE
ncbi:hypothetical protein GQ44DRAFT_704424 [Phaeosphaeriaceae sp. PMI808]|nr:hypothetical protein GQ44DRAFT_704424 [Phaeosphaeriaceae sp. PMI808]